MKTYTDRPTWYAYPEDNERTAPRGKHATISVIKHRMGKLDVVDEYLDDCEQQFKVEYLKRLNGTPPLRVEKRNEEPERSIIPTRKEHDFGVSTIRRQQRVLGQL